ncbi:MAG TPA: class I SAM-dependent methyltransferase [Candidatus Nitrosopolaris sp.]|nr:class I SAM-dependent methyltransferase [Candidatus Nitrosopolaris sp.]
MNYVDEIISVLKKNVFADAYALYDQIENAKMADITKTIAYLQQKKSIRVERHRKNLRTGLNIPVYCLTSEHSSLNRTRRTIARLDLDGLLAGVLSERLVEYGFLARNLGPSRSQMKILDVGTEQSTLTKALSKCGNTKKWEVLGIDIAERLPEALEEEGETRLPFIRMDARFMGFRDEVFDKITCISTVEHIGIQSRHYVVGEYDMMGDVKALSEIFRILKKGGRVVLTVPYIDRSIGGNHKEHRIYNSVTISKLIRRFQVKRKEFYIYIDGKWKSCKLKNIVNKLQPIGNSETPSYLHSGVCLCLLLEK